MTTRRKVIERTQDQQGDISMSEQQWAIYDEHGEIVAVDVVAHTGQQALAQFVYATPEWFAVLQDHATYLADSVDWDRVHDGEASEDDWQRWSEQ